MGIVFLVIPCEPSVGNSFYHYVKTVVMEADTMIDEDRTLQLYGYTSDELSPKSHKRVVVGCEDDYAEEFNQKVLIG